MWKSQVNYRLLNWSQSMKKEMVRGLVVFFLIGSLGASINSFMSTAQPSRILVDTDVDADDVFALFYLLKQNIKEFDLQAITINTNGWSDAGHAINHVYDILYMMGRDNIPVGVGGEGGFLPNATISPNVGGYLSIIDQGMSTAGGCRYRQAIPPGQRGRLDINTMYGLRRAFLPQGERQYNPLQQPTAQQVMIDAISAGPITVFLMGAHTNFAIFLMSNSHLKKNVEHIYIMGGSFRSDCSRNGSSSNLGQECRSSIGNLYPQDSNPYAEFNIFSDPLAAYMILHSGIPVTIVPLDATSTIPVSKNFFSAFESKQDTYEAQYCFQSLKLIRDTWPSDDFHEEYCLWDSFMAGVALSIMRNSRSHEGENDFAEMEDRNFTVITSNEPYGISDGSNPLTNGNKIPMLNVTRNGLHTGHVQMGMRDQFCLKIAKGKCQDGYTMEITGPEAVHALVATRAKSADDNESLLDKEFYNSFLDTINRPRQTGRFSLKTQFPYYKEVVYKPDFGMKPIGKPAVFDMDMSPGDFLALLYLLKLPVELINLKGILISPTGWGTSATVDAVYDILHMMGRDDIPVGLGDVFAIGQADPTYPAIGDCKYAKAIPHGCGGSLDSDTLYGLARELPRSPRRYTAENSVKSGAPRDTDHPEFRQSSTLDIWKSITESLDGESKITILTNGPLTNLAQIIHSDNTSSIIQEVYIVGGHLSNANEKGNIFTIPSNEYAEFNMYLDPLAANAVFESELRITLIPLNMQRRVSSFQEILDDLQSTAGTPESAFSRKLLSRLWKLHQEDDRYHHMDTFLGEILGAVILAGNAHLNQTFNLNPIKIIAEGDVSKLGHIVIDDEHGKLVKVLENVNSAAYYDHFGKVLRDHKQSAVIGSFEEQKRIWNTRPNITKP